MADRRSVRAELEKKRIQLAQMKEERERRSRMRQDDENTLPQQFVSAENKDRLNEDADAVLQAFGLSNLSRASTAPSGVSTMHQQDSFSSTGPHAPNISHLTSKNQSSASLNSSLDVSNSAAASVKKPVVPLQVVHVNQISIAPKEKVYYTKSTQTLEAKIQPGDTPVSLNNKSQSNYYGKQKDSNATTTPLPNSIVANRKSQSKSNGITDSPTNNTQISIGANQLALEWDDEFPGTSRSVEEYSANLSVLVSVRNQTNKMTQS